MEEKEKVGEFEIKKIVEELKRIWKENEEGIRERWEYDSLGGLLFFLSLPLPEVPPSYLEEISNRFLKEFSWKKFGKYFGEGLGLLLSAFLKKNIEDYVLSEKKKGIKESQIEPIKVHLDVEGLPFRLDCLGYENPAELYLIIKGNCGDRIGYEMEGGKIVIKGNCGESAGARMQGGKIIIKRNCGVSAGEYMQDGELNIKGEVKSLGKFGLFYPNDGTIVWKKIKIWENGDWTEEGKEMWERGEIPIE